MTGSSASSAGLSTSPRPHPGRIARRHPRPGEVHRRRGRRHHLVDPARGVRRRVPRLRRQGRQRPGRREDPLRLRPPHRRGDPARAPTGPRPRRRGGRRPDRRRIVVAPRPGLFQPGAVAPAGRRRGLLDLAAAAGDGGIRRGRAAAGPAGHRPGPSGGRADRQADRPGGTRAAGGAGDRPAGAAGGGGAAAAEGLRAAQKHGTVPAPRCWPGATGRCSSPTARRGC